MPKQLKSTIYISRRYDDSWKRSGGDKEELERSLKGLSGAQTLDNKASQAIQSSCTVLFFLLISLLDVYSFANVHVKGIVAFKHLK